MRYIAQALDANVQSLRIRDATRDCRAAKRGDALQKNELEGRNQSQHFGEIKNRDLLESLAISGEFSLAEMIGRDIQKSFRNRQDAGDNFIGLRPHVSDPLARLQFDRNVAELRGNQLQ